MLTRIKEIVHKITEKQFKSIDKDIVRHSQFMEAAAAKIKHLEDRIDTLVDEMVEHALAEEMQNKMEKELSNLDKRIVKLFAEIRRFNEMIEDMNARFVDMQTSIDYVCQYQKSCEMVNRLNEDIIKHAKKSKNKLDDATLKLHNIADQYRIGIANQGKQILAEMHAINNNNGFMNMGMVKNK